MIWGIIAIVDDVYKLQTINSSLFWGTIWGVCDNLENLQKGLDELLVPLHTQPSSRCVAKPAVVSQELACLQSCPSSWQVPGRWPTLLFCCPWALFGVADQDRGVGTEQGYGHLEIILRVKN